MARKSASPLLHLVRRALEDPRVHDLPDHELLRRFGSDRDETAFDGLLRRHGPMVLDVCRNVLGNEADAEDAFQATFLVLARKATTIRRTTSVGSWLYGVAYRTALKARAEAARRQKREARRPEAVAETRDDLSWRDVQQVLHAELQRFSARYRAPLVLCYLEGKTQDEAARSLGVSRATLKKYLERGRMLLRARLVRRGLGPAALLMASAWPAATASAGLSPALLSITTRAAIGLAAGHSAAGLVSARVAGLTQGALQAMFLTKLRTITAAALILFLVPLLGGLALWARANPVAPAGFAGAEPGRAALADKGDDPPPAAAAGDDWNVLQGAWLRTDPKQGRVRLSFNEGLVPGTGVRALVIRWTPPAEDGPAVAPVGGGGLGGGGLGGGGLGGGGLGGGGLGGGGLGGGRGLPAGGLGGGTGGGVGGAAAGGRGIRLGCELEEMKGKKALVLTRRQADDVRCPYKLDGDTLTLDGGTYEVARPGGPAFLKVELKGQWKRVNVALETRLRQALPSVDVESFDIQVESRPQRLAIVANKATVEADGRIRLENCVVARFTGEDAARGSHPTTVHSEHAVFKLDRPAQGVGELANGTIVSVEFADGVRMELKGNRPEGKRQGP